MDRALTHREKSLLIALGSRQGRKRSGMCRCEGLRAVRELFLQCPQAVKLVAATDRGYELLPEIPENLLRIVGEKEFETISATINNQGIMALAEIPPETIDAPKGDFILALDGVADPGNLGTILRTFRSIGGSDVWYTTGSAEPWGDKAIRSGMGAQFALKFRKFPDLTALAECGKKYGYDQMFVADPHKGENCFQCEALFDKSILVIGGEANGAQDPPESALPVTIPMPGNYESINAAQAATVLLFEYVRRNTAEAKRSK